MEIGWGTTFLTGGNDLKKANIAFKSSSFAFAKLNHGIGGRIEKELVMSKERIKEMCFFEEIFSRFFEFLPLFCDFRAGFFGAVPVLFLKWFGALFCTAIV